MAGRRLLPGVSVVKNKDGTTSYRASGYTPAGRKVAKTFRTIKAANGYKRDLEHDKEHGTFVEPSAGRITFADYFKEAMARSPSLSPKTVYGYWSTARNWILPHLGSLALSAITRDVIASWIAKVSAEGGAAVAWSAYRVLARTLARAEEESRIVRNPATHMTQYLPRKPGHRKDVRVLTRWQVRTIADEVSARYRALVLLLGYLGPRFGEAISLRRADIVPATEDRVGYVTFHESTTEVPGLGMVTGGTKSRRSRSIPIDIHMSAILLDHMERFTEPDPDALVFTGSRDGSRYLRLNNWRRSEFAGAIARSVQGHVTVHDLRATAITNWIEGDGVSPMLVRSWVGHQSSSVTEVHYFRPTEDQVQRVMDRVSVSIASALQGDHLPTGPPSGD